MPSKRLAAIGPKKGFFRAKAGYASENVLFRKTPDLFRKMNGN
jgi:hypothetical protein